MTTADAHEHDGRVMEPPASPIVWAGTLGIIAMAVLRTLVMFAPQLYFDSDPTIVSERFPGIGIAGSLLIDVITILCACLALGGLSLQSVRVRWWVVGLVCIGGVFVAMHGTGDATDLWRGSTWFAALLSAVVIAHLPGHDALRRIVLIILLASLAPLMLRGGHVTPRGELSGVQRGLPGINQ